MNPGNSAMSLQTEVQDRVPRSIILNKIHRTNMKETGNTENTEVKDNLQDCKLINIQTSSAASSVTDVANK